MSRKANLRAVRRRRAEKDRKEQRKKTKIQTWLPHLKRIGAGVSFLGGILYMLSLALQFPKQVHDFSRYGAEASKLASNVIWASDAWSGIYSNYPEGEVAMADMNLTEDASLFIDIKVTGNFVDGSISDNSFCQIPLPRKDKLLEGKVHLGGRSASATVFDFFAGHRVDLFHLRLVRDGTIVTIEGAPDKYGINGARIASVPLDSGPAKVFYDRVWATPEQIYCPAFLEQLR